MSSISFKTRLKGAQKGWSLLKKKSDKGLSGRRVQYIYVVLNMALTVAENDRTIQWNPCRPVTLRDTRPVA